ncbi:MAG: zinc ribbon domain-containing protein [Gammaproteobacteria bacterium]
MPIYEYECKACGHHLEALQKLSDTPLKKCPECGKPALRKLMSAAGFRLKGAGWYETDFKSGNKKHNLVDSGDKPVKEIKEGKESKEKKPAETATASKGDKSKTDKPKSDKKSGPQNAATSASS